MQKLDYTEKFLKECLRMWPPAVGILTRVVTKDHQLGPFKLKKDSLIGTNILGLMHNPKYYKNPEIFDPERWSDK
jgi:cytochrome P450